MLQNLFLRLEVAELLSLELVHPLHEFFIRQFVLGDVLDLEGLSLEGEILELRQAVAHGVLVYDGVLR